MILNGCNHHFPRQSEKACLEPAHDRHRPLHQRRDLIEQVALDQGAAAGRLGCGRHAGPHRLAPRAEIGNHLRAREPFLVGAGRLERDGLGRVKAVTARRAARRQTEHLHRYDLFAVQEHHAVHGPHEFGSARPPAHAPRNRQRRYRLLDQRPEDARGGRASLNAPEHQPGTLVGDQALELRHLRAAITGERQSGLRGRAGRIEGVAHGRTAALDVAICGGVGAIGDEHRQPPRGGIAARGPVGDAGTVQSLDQPLRERRRQARERARGQLLGQQLEQQIAPAHEPAAAPLSSGKPSASRLSRYASATARASVRTRRMKR